MFRTVHVSSDGSSFRELCAWLPLLIKQLCVDGSLAYSLSVQCGQNLRLFFLMKQILREGMRGAVSLATS